jgi:transposase InsO family protein
VVEERKRLDLIRQAHDELGHKGVFTVRIRLAERFWWPHMETDIKWFIRTCHECQVRLVKKIIIPPSVPTPAGLFRKVYIDTMLMPKAKGYRYIIHARCSLSSFPEWAALRNENFKTIAKFIHEVILCRWGAIEIIVSDNAPQYIQAIEYLAEKYNIRYIRISPYNSRAQGPIERRHYDVREAIVKAADGDESKWVDVAPSVFWAERVSIQKSTGYSPFYIAHGVEPLLPFDLAEATYLAPKMDSIISTEDLIAQRAKMLQKRPQDLERVKEMVLKARWESVRQLEKSMKDKIHDFNFKPGQLVLVRNSKNDKSLTDKTKPRYLGPMVVIRRTHGGSYILGELDGSLSKLRYAAFRLIPYLPRDVRSIPVTKLLDIPQDELENITHESGNPLDVENEPEDD